MTWQGFLYGSRNVARITGLVILNILMFLLNVIFFLIKVTFFLVVFMLTLGRVGAGTMDFGGRRR